MDDREWAKELAEIERAVCTREVQLSLYPRIEVSKKIYDYLLSQYQRVFDGRPKDYLFGIRVEVNPDWLGSQYKIHTRYDI